MQILFSKNGSISHIMNRTGAGKQEGDDGGTCPLSLFFRYLTPSFHCSSNRGKYDRVNRKLELTEAEKLPLKTNTCVPNWILKRKISA